MSFSKPHLQNPSKKFIEWKSDDKCFSYYDKETSKNVLLPLPIYFIALDELSCVTGFCEKHKTNLFSNEVKSTVSEPLVVRTFKGGERIVGLYQDIKAEAKELGGKYTKSIYAMLIMPNKEPELVNIKLRGSANSAWIDKKISTEKNIICVKESLEEKKGATVYNVPVFSRVNMVPEHRAAAEQMDIALQSYLKDYFDQQMEAAVATEEAAEQPAYVADAEQRLKEITSQATRPPNAILDSGWVKQDRKNKAKLGSEGPVSDPALLDEGISGSEDPGSSDLPF